MQNDQEERSNEITGGIASETSAATELIANNVDLLTEILVRLPAKSLLRFKCVSKHWFSLISHSQFASNHSIRNPRPSGLYFYLHNQLHSVSLCGGRNLPSLSFLDGFGEQSTTRVLQSCNGLLLCHNAHYDGHIRKLLLIVCNPTTKKHTILNSPHISESLSSDLAYLAFDPSKSPHYKVLLSNPSFSLQIDVYCSQSACWKQVTIHQIHQIHRDRGVFWNGAIHWFTGENSLLRFDVNAEEMIVMPNSQTPKILTRDRTMYFGESGGSLILIQSTSHISFKSEILELDEDYSSWIGKYHVNLKPLIAAFPEMKNKNFYIMHVEKGDKERDFALVLAIPGRIVWYDLKCKSWNVLRELSADEPIIFSLDHYAYPFVETLFPISTYPDMFEANVPFA